MKFGVAISSFKSDDSVIYLINKIKSEDWNIEKIIVIDSLGSGKIINHIKDNNLSNFVDYYNYNENLGSAMNLQYRIEKAYKLDIDFVLTLNHDAFVSKEIFDTLVNNSKKVNGAVFYCLRYFPKKKIFDLTGLKEPSFLPSNGPKIQPKSKIISCVWSSSSIALYSTEPFSKNIKPDGSLWMGWEDYLYGIQLQKNGYKQYIVSEAFTEDNYEFEAKKIMGKKVHFSNKPHWYYYYRGRNLLLICLHIEFNIIRLFRTLFRFNFEGIAIVFTSLNDRPFKAIFYFFIGIFHGIINRRGKWKVPN